MADIWVISDTHFGHSNIIHFCDRPFKDAKEMDWTMVERWNALVKPSDHVWHLGDVYMKSTNGYANHLLNSLNGHKRLILGNHDLGTDKVLLAHFEKIVLWRDWKDFGILMSHIPLHPSSIIKDRVNVHGHIHNRESPDGPYLNVCVEKTNYGPINIEQLRQK